MTQERRRQGGLSEEELDALAARLGKNESDCKLTPEQQQAVLDIIAMKKKGVKYFLWLVGALFLWILKDVYLFIQSHLDWIKTN